ncbi:MAG: hypothetical protein NTW03_07680 [Verrucomicrobia bacterium]|nr:hypothetical protein [Verrucomicrobiota bacterium]
MFLQFFTEADIKTAHHKEAHNEGDENHVIHNENHFSRPQRGIALAGAIIKTGAENVKKTLKFVVDLRSSRER